MLNVIVANFFFMSFILCMVKLSSINAVLNNIQQKSVINIPNINIKNKFCGEIITLHKRNSYNPIYTTTELLDNVGKTLGKEVFCYEDGNPISTGMSIEVIPEYRNKGFNLGEILRLSSIMMIIENKIREFEIHSKNTAIYFHSKYFFEPRIKQFEERDSALNSIMRNCENKDEFLEYKTKANLLLEKASSNKDAVIQRNLCVETNDLLKKYIRNVLQVKGRYEEHPFDYGMNMSLTQDNIMENKLFFNKLFEKHGIDYSL